jgi:hypothetical protein
MRWKNTTSRYSSPFIAMHWVMVLLIIAAYACIELRTQFPRRSDMREALKSWHFTLALQSSFCSGLGAFDRQACRTDSRHRAATVEIAAASRARS